jgi:hypothetical protein
MRAADSAVSSLLKVCLLVAAKKETSTHLNFGERRPCISQNRECDRIKGTADAWQSGSEVLGILCASMFPTHQLPECGFALAVWISHAPRFRCP